MGALSFLEQATSGLVNTAASDIHSVEQSAISLGTTVTSGAASALQGAGAQAVTLFGSTLPAALNSGADSIYSQLNNDISSSLNTVVSAASKGATAVEQGAYQLGSDINVGTLASTYAPTAAQSVAAAQAVSPVSALTAMVSNASKSAAKTVTAAGGAAVSAAVKVLGSTPPFSFISPLENAASTVATDTGTAIQDVTSGLSTAFWVGVGLVAVALLVR